MENMFIHDEFLVEEETEDTDPKPFSLAKKTKKRKK
jgi:hypothetical protein